MSEGASIDELLTTGQTRLRAHMLNLAELIFQRVLAKEPENLTALRLLGVTLHKMGESDAAITHLRAATELAPEIQFPWWDLAVVLRDAGQTEQAQAALVRALALVGRDPAATPLPPLTNLTLSDDRASRKVTVVDYPYNASIRYGAGRPSHPELAELIGQGRTRYAAFLNGLGEIQRDFAEVPMGGSYEASTPFWLNSWYPALDGMVLTGMLRAHAPKRFIEIGSGMSTKFARRAVQTYGLATTLMSIDPEPRNSVDKLCDEVIRRPLENCDLKIFQTLEAGDILFLDSSHRAFQNSDVTVFFLDILPRLKPGVILHIHDIYLPDDYISGHVFRMWNEQYLLATALLFGGDRFEVLFPTWFVGQDPELSAHAKGLLQKGPLGRLDLYGASFWMRTT